MRQGPTLLCCVALLLLPMLCCAAFSHFQAAPGSSPDVWCRLPAAVNRFALDSIQNDDKDSHPDPSVLRLFSHLTAAAMGTIQTDQQQEVLGLRERTAAVEAAQIQQQQETAALQQQVQELQAAIQQLLQDRR